MSKIRETLALIKSGARSNKYRVLYPVFSNEIDIICTSTGMPGRDVSTVEAYVKGRKFLLAGEMADEGSWEMTIYNTPDHIHRRFFMKMIGGIHNFNTPSYLNDGGSMPKTSLSGGTNMSVSGAASSAGGGIGDFLGGVSAAVSAIDTAYQDLKNVWGSAAKVSSDLKQAINGDWQSLEALISSNGYSSSNWYQQDVIIQQLDSNDVPITQMVLHNCFVTGVSPIEYSDESAEISTCTISFAYSGTSVGFNAETYSSESY